MPEKHFASYPTELPETCLLAGCPPGGLVLAPFAGTGTTGLANGRRFFGIELSADYIAIAHKRLNERYPLLAGGAEAVNQFNTFSAARVMLDLVDHIDMRHQDPRIETRGDRKYFHIRPYVPTVTAAGVVARIRKTYHLGTAMR
jgi:hypothetical protein